ncbi:SH2 domain-containing protein 2A isoform X2 [Nycticebus coucang]|uniref:SH2 domain-containing protein 2A isoform X2 n=1 Tax=Nycticebus coucang TaxID=9470 RepID=UPI00234D55F4|nr:SH2 domain-containing protein 2A isoform X2 [Nycticebus coucang]
MEFPLTQICPQGSHKAPTPTFSTFQPMNLTRRSYQDLGLLSGPRLQALRAEEAQPNPVAPESPSANSSPIQVSPQAPSAAHIPGNAEEVPGEGSLTLKAETRTWFQKTQAHWLLQHGAAPAWFHGFITRREAERLLEPQPQGCYLVRFSESAVAFVLTYRSRTCCRHFLLAQLTDGRHVVLGEDSAHPRLQGLLQHYSAHPLSPYGETLAAPLARQTPEPIGLFLRTEEPDSGSKSWDPNPQYSPIIRKGQAPASIQKERSSEPKEPSQPPRPRPPIPTKPQLPPEAYASPSLRPRLATPLKPTNPIYHEPDEPIAFYAMGRGSPGEAPSNIYAEVEGEGPLSPPMLQKCPSRPVPGGQSSGGPQLYSENSVARQGPSLPHKLPSTLRHTLPHNLSR